MVYLYGVGGELCFAWKTTGRKNRCVEVIITSMYERFVEYFTF